MSLNIWKSIFKYNVTPGPVLVWPLLHLEYYDSIFVKVKSVFYVPNDTSMSHNNIVDPWWNVASPNTYNEICQEICFFLLFVDLVHFQFVWKENIYLNNCVSINCIKFLDTQWLHIDPSQYKLSVDVIFIKYLVSSLSSYYSQCLLIIFTVLI